MGPDIVEIALNAITDHVDFEKLASEVMLGEGYHDIKPLGGVRDKGRDAVQESYFLCENPVRTVFQYTLEEYLPRKIEKTVKRLADQRIEFTALVVVTRHPITTERQDQMKKEARAKQGVVLEIYEWKTLVNRLSCFDNGIFHRHFPDIRAQIADLSASAALHTGEPSSALEDAMLRVSLALSLSETASHTRRVVADNLVLALILAAPDHQLAPSEIAEQYSTLVRCEREVPVEQIDASVRRLEARALVRREGLKIEATGNALTTTAARIIQANVGTQTLVDDVIDGILRATGSAPSDQETCRIARNVRYVLVALMRCYGLEVAKQLVGGGALAGLRIPASEELMKAAKKQLRPEIGDLVIAGLAERFVAPTPDQARTLAGWAQAYLGVAIMGLDPKLRELQASRVAGKTFILDTDIVLDLMIRETPVSSTLRVLVQKLVDLGCRVIIPVKCVDECLLHASISSRTYNHFGEGLLQLGAAHVEQMVRNAFVKGFYHGMVSGSLPAGCTFERYLENYYEPKAPDRFAREVIAGTFPSEVKILNPTDLLDREIPDKQHGRLTEKLIEHQATRTKTAYRTLEETRELAKTDARLYLTAYYLNEAPEGSSEHVLGGRCYLVTNSLAYARATRAIGIVDQFAARPAALLAIQEVIGQLDISPVEFLGLFENPFLVAAVAQSWNDVERLVKSGIDLKGKSLPRLRWDLDTVLHERMTAVVAADEEAELREEVADQVAMGDEAYLELLGAAASRGYTFIPEVAELRRALDQVRGDAKAKAEALDALLERFTRLEQEVEHFGRRRQRYLRRVARGDDAKR